MHRWTLLPQLSLIFFILSVSPSVYGDIPPLVIGGQEVEATNAYLNDHGQPRHQLARENLSKDPVYWQSLKTTWTETLYQMGMDFIKKGDSGFYDTPFAVPVEPMVTLLDRKWLDSYADATKLWLETCRQILQVIYGMRRPTVAAVKAKLAISNSRFDGTISTLLQRFRDSPYFIPAFVDGSMLEYPFLTVTGWDAIIDDVGRATGYSFEVNAGTPSGLSNLTALLSRMNEVDPEQYSKLTEYLGDDNTFRKFTDVLRQAARKWTKNNGIVVVVSPGEYNGAHPDVAMISYLTGMPLASPGDLFVGEDGSVYLDEGSGLPAQKVIGIYSRAEESFLFQEGRLISQGAVPMIQQWHDNRALGKRLGVKLLDNVWYDYQLAEDFSVTGVRVASSGEPKLATYYSRVIDQNRNGGKSLRQLVLERKIFVNHIGGRVIDDKKAFRLIQKLAQSLYPGKSVAGPPVTLSDNEYDQLLEEPDQFVVKRATGSGGDGVYVLRNLTADQQQNIISEVYQSKGQGYTIQRFMPSISQPTVYNDGNWRFAQLLGDLRIFVYLYPSGQVHIGNRGFLYRISPFDEGPGKAGKGWSLPKANTSLGGGYGMIVVRDSGTQTAAVTYPPRRATSSSRRALTEFRQLIRGIAEGFDRGVCPDSETLRQLSYVQKTIMPLLGWDSAPLRAWADRLLLGQGTDVAAANFRKVYGEFKANLPAIGRNVANVSASFWTKW